MFIINKMLLQSGFAIIVVGLLAAPVLAHLRRGCCSSSQTIPTLHGV